MNQTKTELFEEGLTTLMQQVVNLYTVPTRPFDVWLDGDGHVRRVKQTIDFSVVRFPPSSFAIA